METHSTLPGANYEMRQQCLDTACTYTLLSVSLLTLYDIKMIILPLWTFMYPTVIFNTVVLSSLRCEFAHAGTIAASSLM